MFLLIFATFNPSRKLGPSGRGQPPALHCMEDKQFASSVEQWGGEIEIATPPLNFADIKAFAYKSDVAAPTSTAAEPRTPPTWTKPDDRPLSTPSQSSNTSPWLFSMEAARIAFEIRQKIDRSCSSNASSEPEPSPSPPRTGEPEPSPSPSPPRTDETSTENFQYHRQASTSSANGGSTCSGSHQELETSGTQSHCAHGEESSDEIAGRIGQPPSSAPTTHDSAEQCFHQEQRDPPLKDTPVISFDRHIEVDKVNKMAPNLHALSGIESLLCIADPWCRMVASGEKTWELRSVPTSKRNFVE